MLYDGWMSELACRADKRFSEIVATHNFDLGPEFEIALASFLREWLPSRVGVCAMRACSASTRSVIPSVASIAMRLTPRRSRR